MACQFVPSHDYMAYIDLHVQDRLLNFIFHSLTHDPKTVDLCYMK